MRQLYPLLWVATLGLGAVILLRSGGLGTLLALAANWENPPWSDTYTPSAPRSPALPPTASGPSAPGLSSRPAAWPGASPASDVNAPPYQDPRDADSRTRSFPANPLRPSPDLPAEETSQSAAHREDSQQWATPHPYSYSQPSSAPDDPASRRDPPADFVPRDGRPHEPPTAEPPEKTRHPETNPGEIVPRPIGSQDQPLPWSHPVPDATPCEGAEALGRIGSEVILTKELSWGIAELRSQNKEVPKEVLEAKIREILKQRLDQRIDERLILQDLRRTIPAENLPKIRDNVAREFEASQVPRLMKMLNARTRQELDTGLEASGSSLEMQKRNFVDGVLAHEWLRQQAKIDEDVSHEQRLAYYREHVSQFETPARARWEQLTVKKSRFPSREDAYAALAQMGNQVIDGAPLAEVAKAQSHGATAQQGGFWDWTSQGSLASQVLDWAIFGDGTRPGLPVGALSPILEDEQALHIIRVVKREPPHCTPFKEAQVEIVKKIRAEREVKAKQDYLAKLRRQTPVWTAFDTPAQASRSVPNRYLQ